VGTTNLDRDDNSWELTSLPMYQTIATDQKLMRTTIDIDDTLMRKALRLSRLTTKKTVVEASAPLHSNKVSGTHPSATWQD
jgi:hypothetical protein